MQCARPIHPLVVRITHWVNAAAVIVMIASGLAIHNAYPTLPFPVPLWLTAGGFIAGLRWHFAAMWVLMINLAVMLAVGIFSGRYRRKLWPIRIADLRHDLRDALSGRLSHTDLSVYNAVQRLLYAGVLVALTIAVLTGLSIWKPVQFRLLTDIFGDFDTARILHFLAMTAIVLFLLVHIGMAFLVPRTLLAMFRGR